MLIKSIYLENFKGIQKLGDNVKLQFPLKTKEIILIKGENGFGKTTILENLHPFPFMLTRNIKDSINYPAKKEIIFFKNNDEYKGVIIWEDEKNTKGFLYKNNKIVKATEKGNITEYIHQIENLFDSWEKFQTSVFLKQGVLDIINAKPTERLNIINKFMPNLDIFDNLKNDFKTKEAEIKLEIKKLKEDLQNIEKYEEKYENVKKKEKIYNEKTIKQAKEELKKIENEYIIFKELVNNLENKKILLKQLEDEINFLKKLEKEINELKKTKKEIEKKLKGKKLEDYEKELENLKKIQDFKQLLEKYNYSFNKYKKLLNEKNTEQIKALLEQININEHNKKLKNKIEKEIQEIKNIYPKWTPNLENLIINIKQFKNFLNENNIKNFDITKLNKKNYEKDIKLFQEKLTNTIENLKNAEIELNNTTNKISATKEKLEKLNKYLNDIKEIENFNKKFPNIKEQKQNIDNTKKLIEILEKNKIAFEDFKSFNKENKYNKLIELEKEGIETKQKVNELKKIIEKKLSYRKIDWNKIQQEYEQLEKQYITKNYIGLINDTCPICSSHITPEKKEEIKIKIENFDANRYEELKNLILNKHKIEEENKKYLEQQQALEELKKLEQKLINLRNKYVVLKQQQEEYEFFNDIKNYLPENYINIANIHQYLEKLIEEQKLFEKKQLLEARLENLKSVINIKTLNNDIDNTKKELESLEKEKKELEKNIKKYKVEKDEIEKKIEELNVLQKEYLIYKRYKELEIDINLDIKVLEQEKQMYDKYKMLLTQLKNINIDKKLEKYNKEELEKELNLLIETENYNVDEIPKNLEDKIYRMNNKITEIIKLQEQLKNIEKQLDKDIPDIKTKQNNYRLLKQEIMNIEKKLSEFDKNFENIYLETKKELNKFIEEYNEFIIEKRDIEKLYFEYKEKEEKIKKFQEEELIYNQLKNASDKIKKTIIANTFDKIINTANIMLENEGTIKLKIFINQINNKKFEISVMDLITERKIGDVSLLSGAEKMVVQKALSIALASNTNFKTLWMDEADGMLSEKNRNLYVNMLRNIFNLLDIEEIFLISHNKEVEKEADTIIDLNKMIKYNY